MTENYILKHKNIPLVNFTIDTDNYEVVKINELIDEDKLPFIIGKENKEISCILGMNKWLKKRGLSGSREDYIEMLFETGASSGKVLTIYSLGLNLSDHYWIHKEKYDYKWENLNFFDNNFKEVVLKELLNSEDDTSNIHPDFSVDGSLKKKWVCFNNERYLLKGSRTVDNQEVFNEVIVSKILDFYNIDHVKYETKKFEGKAVSICKCMVDRDTELIPARYIFEKGGKIKDNPYNHFINVCDEHGIKNTKDKLDEMIILDCIIGNEDRHKRNFGIIRDANSFKWLKIAPIFDNGNSLCFRNSADIINFEKRTDSYCKWTSDLYNYKGNLENLKYIDCDKWHNRINSDTIIDIVADGFIGKINDEKKDKIITITKNRLNFVEEYLLEQRNKITTGFDNTNSKELEKASFIQGVCISIIALKEDANTLSTNGKSFGQLILSENKLTVNDCKKYAPEQYEILKNTGFFPKQEQEKNTEIKR